ncbi:hypothetical protein [Spirosoma foliorum]|uniref:Uncharacterized protein n=1 Tax=Spirosoma foliorum TaxID=2710596 RepID=A0A7G5H107_9BACT|nr:hypothetical protein [Spirosoma foliorum]QMW04799.1 hypothetical protein H3H32_07725 [Spirosoma foliorum]
MFEMFVGDVVFYCTANQTLAKDRIKAICSTKVKGKSKHVYTLYNGLSKLEDELFLSLKRAKNHFERSNITLEIPKELDTD